MHCPECEKELKVEDGYGDCEECKLVVIHW